MRPARPRTVRKGHDLLPSGGEGKAPEVDPRPAAHRLIDGKRGLAAEVANRIMRVVGAFGRRFVAHINRIFAPFGNVGLPHGTARAPRRSRSAHGASCRRGRDFRPYDRPAAGARSPRRRLLPTPPPRAYCPAASLSASTSYFCTSRSRGSSTQAPAFSSIGTRYGKHVTLRIEVLAGLPQRRTLPFPAVLGLVEIASVALPQGDMASRKSPSTGSREPKSASPAAARSGW